MSVYEGYNSVVAATGEDLDGILAKVKVATPATASGPGEEGLVPAPPVGSEDGGKVLVSDMTWASIGGESNNDIAVKGYVDNKVKEAASAAKMKKRIVDALPDPGSAEDNVIYLIKDNTASGSDNNVYTEYILVSPEGGGGSPVLEALGTIQTKVEPYILPKASNDTLGGVKTGYTESGKNYGVKVDSNGKMFVLVPWTDTTYSNATSSAPGLMSSADKSKLDGLNNYTLPTTSASALGGVKVGYTTNGKNYKVQVDESGNAYVNVPWTDTNTTYNEATTSAAGLMSAADKTKLNGLNNYSLPTSTASVLGGIKVGYTTSGKNYKVQLDDNGNAYVNVPWTDNNTTYSVATTSANGLMSKEDKSKLNGIAAGANNYSLPKSTASALGGVMIGYSANGKNYAVQLDTSGKAYVNVPWTDTNTTYNAVTQSANGLMTAADKKLLDFQTGANSVTSLANLPVTKRLVKANLSGATTISVVSGMTIGQELYVRCTPSASFTQAIPNTGSFTSLSGSSFAVTSGKAFEMSILKIADSGVMYSIILKEAE
ncbi:head fiber protein [Parabacteroides goldsteinii]|uniref:head fiber protein n=1 Tax=Parabacteroides goldsteinii TaxID=328812 RepID=UPI0027296A88|nr:head fiber protein [Parabacteroides goldsteinii]